MKAIIVTSDAFPNGMATGKRILCYARALKEGGIDCEVLVCRRTERYGIPPKNTLGDGSVDGIHFHYIGGTPLRGDNVFIRRLNDCLDLLNTRRYLRDTLRPGDILFLYLRNITPSLCFINVARRKGVKCVCDLCELPFGTGTETAKARRLRKKMLGVVFPRLDGIISISNALMELAQNHASPTCKHIKVPILVDFDHYYLPDRSMFADVPFIFHSGTLTQQKDGVLGMIEAFGKAARSLPFPIQFISTGQLENSPHEVAIQDLIIRYDLQGKIRFTGFLSEDELRDYLSRATLVIINKGPTLQNKYCFSTKLGEYMAAGKCVIITDYGEAINWLTDGKDAIIVATGNTEALSDAVVDAFTDADKRLHLGKAGQELCHKCFDYKEWSPSLVKFLRSL